MSEHTDEPLPQPPQLLIDTLFPDQNVSSQPNRPHVTLTFAQSIDGKIAGKGGQQLLLSGRDSLIMTHW
ncbi:hypothetical protein BDW22DRAFT_1350339 [Trametopsis cervina]|nr:hypothetical protein BDW22DRAFT_1350339 [Trametopsis cervina]